MSAQSIEAGAGVVTVAAVTPADARASSSSRPSAEELGRAAATELRGRIARSVRTKAEARRAARAVVKLVTARHCKRGDAAHEYVRRVCEEIAEGFAGSRTFERRGRLS